MKWWSREWFDAFIEKANGDEEYLEKAKRLTMKCEILAKDAPGGVDLLSVWETDKGRVISITIEEKPAPSDWREVPVDQKEFLLRATAPWEVFASLHRGEIYPFIELLKKGMTVQGDLANLLAKMLPEFVAFLEFQNSVPASEY